MSVHIDSPARHAAGPPPARPRPARRSRRSRLAWLDIKASPYLFVAPFFVIFLVFLLYPFLYTAYVATRDWTLGSQESTSVGFANFTALFKDAQFWNAVRNTLGIFVISTIPQLLMALGVANLLNKRIRSRTLLRMGILVPFITSVAVVGLVFNELFSRDYGAINWVLMHVHAIAKPIDWKADKWSSWIAIATMVNWRWTGYNALIYLAAMQSIPRDIYESASLDGARSWTQFWRITVPMLRPTIIFTVIISTIGGLQLFGEPMTFGTGAHAEYGGTLHQYQTVTMYLWEQMFSHYRLGYAGAVAMLLFLLIILVAVINFAIVRRINSEK